MDDETGFVYVISDGEAFKIGVSSNPEGRLRQLQTANRATLELVWCEAKRKPYLVEKVVHRSLHKYRTKGEWFEGLTFREIRIALLLCTEYD